MDCPRCGVFSPPGAQRCGCGCPLDAAPPPSRKKRPQVAGLARGRPLRVAILAGLAVALAIVRLLALAH